MSGARDALPVDDLFSIEELMREIARYLTVVDVFRAAGREPVWLPESAPGAGALPRDSGFRITLISSGQTS